MTTFQFPMHCAKHVSLPAVELVFRPQDRILRWESPLTVTEGNPSMTATEASSNWSNLVLYFCSSMFFLKTQCEEDNPA